MAVTSYDGRVAAITGAASGIGRALSVELARRGAHLALSDIDESGLAETEAHCAGTGVKVTTRLVDTADAGAVVDWADAVAAEHGRVNLVVNNAGVALVSPVRSMSLDDLRWLVDVDFWGVVHGTKAFLPHLEASGEGHVVNMASVFGLVSMPAQSAYNAAKFAVRGFTDALRMELDIARSPVSCTTVLPGGVRTNIARRARIDPAARQVGARVDDLARRFDLVARTSPEAAARRILAAVVRNRRRVLVGNDARFLDLVSRLPPALYQRVVVTGARLAR
jgi:short-subunit dehydrogenase